MKIFNQLKKVLSLALILCLATQMQAADIDLAKAQSAAKSFMTKQVANGRLQATAASNLKLVKAEASVANPKAVDYYIFNADKAYVVVSGDDLAPEILMYGEEGTIDLGNIPPAMQWLLNKYKYQIDGLKAGTLVPNNYTPKATTAVAPLTNANWDQSSPYNNQCPTSGSSRTLTGCPATSLAMCYYVWKWPKTFPAVAAINGSSSGGVSAAALGERAADWDNIIDEYTGPTNYSSTTAQKTAVAWLMRYAGQSIPDYMYGTDASGANDPEIYQGVINMGYTDAQLLTLTEIVQSGWGYSNSSQHYTDAQWNEWMLAELHAGNPIEYLAYDYSSYQLAGHAFNVFGCNTSGQYYVNWGWSGDSNGYCTLHNFTTNTGATGQSGSYVFNYGEAMIIGIRPPAGALGPNIAVDPASIAFEGYVGETYTNTFTVTGYNLEDNITITKQGASNITVSPTTITAANAANGVQVTVTYQPTAAGNSNAVITLASEGADNVTVNVTASAEPRVPTIKVEPASISMAANLSSTVTKTINVTGMFLTNNITVTLNDNNGVFSVSPTTITAANAVNGVPVTVSFNSANEGNFTGSIVFTSNGAETKTVQLTASAAEGGNATDPYLNIAKYNTIGQAGATVSGMSSIYRYTEYPSDACAWLTVSNYGARKADANQNWLNCEGEDKSESESWNATDIFLGSNKYFTGSAYYANWNEAYQNFYVTNCSQVKQLSYNIQSSYYSDNRYPLKMYIYECTLNADGSITAGTSTVDYKQSQQTNTPEVITSIDLDPSKIYLVKIYNDYSRLYEIGFKTPIQGIDTPVATDATEVGATEFTAHWTACENAQSYTLRVMPKPEITTELLLTEGFSNFTSNGNANISGSLNNYMDNAGWTGATLYTAVGGIRIGSGSATGTLTSPALDLTNSNGKVSIVYKAKTYNNDTNCNMTISCGSSTATVTIPNSTETEYTQVLDCTEAAGQKVTFATTANRKRVIITSIEIYAGDITTGEAKAEGEMLFPGITGTQYTVTGLQPLTTYIYDVKAIYPTLESNWSNLIEVTTLEQSSTTVAGDVNGDGEVTSVDITVLYNFLLSGDTEYMVNGDQNQDGEITAGDVTFVYNILLGVPNK
jgi:hypothetical protein